MHKTEMEKSEIARTGFSTAWPEGALGAVKNENIKKIGIKKSVERV